MEKKTRISSSFSIYSPVTLDEAGVHVMLHFFAMLFMHPFHSSVRHWSTADAEIKVPSVENLELTNGLPLKPGNVRIQIYTHSSPNTRNVFIVLISTSFPPHSTFFFFFFFNTDGCNSKLHKLAIYSDLCFELVWTNCDYMNRPEVTLCG